MTITEFIEAAAHNKIIQLVVLAIVCDTVFGVLRAIKEKKFNSCAGIDGAIRKVGMLISLVFMLAIDVLIKINLIGFIPEQARTYLGLDAKTGETTGKGVFTIVEVKAGQGASVGLSLIHI